MNGVLAWMFVRTLPPAAARDHVGDPALLVPPLTADEESHRQRLRLASTRDDAHRHAEEDARHAARGGPFVRARDQVPRRALRSGARSS